MRAFKDEFAEKLVKRYMDEGLWLNCSLSDYYFYLEYFADGGYGTIHKVRSKSTGEILILKRSMKKEFIGGTLNQKQKLTGFEEINGDLKPGKEAEFMVKVHEKLGGLKLYDYYDDDDHYILVMENGGKSLDFVLNPRSVVTKQYTISVVNYIIKIYKKIRELHELGIHHNDLKPENILVDSYGDITVIDFGVSKSVEEYYERFRGTLEYVPYEYAMNGSYKPWDHTIWSFGIMLHLFFLKQYPFLDEQDVIDYNLNKEKLNGLPMDISNLIYDCLNINPLLRPQNLLERLEQLKLN
jgi:serine/threonine protein kinase